MEAEGFSFIMKGNVVLNYYSFVIFVSYNILSANIVNVIVAMQSEMLPSFPFLRRTLCIFSLLSYNIVVVLFFTLLSYSFFSLQT